MSQTVADLTSALSRLDPTKSFQKAVAAKVENLQTKLEAQGDGARVSASFQSLLSATMRISDAETNAHE